MYDHTRDQTTDRVPSVGAPWGGNRRDFLKSALTAGAALGLPMALGGCHVLGAAGRRKLDFGDDFGVLNYAYALEELEAEFYTRGVGAGGLLPADTRDVFDQIRKHEVAHVAFLRRTLGARAVAKPTFDFTAGGQFGDVFTNGQTFAALAQAFEDTGVRAYKGQVLDVVRPFGRGGGLS